MVKQLALWTEKYVFPTCYCFSKCKSGQRSTKICAMKMSAVHLFMMISCKKLRFAEALDPLSPHFTPKLLGLTSLPFSVPFHSH